MTSRTRHECWEATYVHVRRYSLNVFLKKFVGAVGDFTTAAVILVLTKKSGAGWNEFCNQQNVAEEATILFGTERARSYFELRTTNRRLRHGSPSVYVRPNSDEQLSNFVGRSLRLNSRQQRGRQRQLPSRRGQQHELQQLLIHLGHGDSYVV